MRFAKSQSALCLLAVSLLSSCGSPGVPLPPSLELAKPVTDLKAVRKGDKVFLTWSAPTLTADRHNIQHPGPTEICRSIGSTLNECGTPVAKMGLTKVAEGKNSSKPQVSFTDELPAALQSSNRTSRVIYAVSVLNSYGRSAGISNKVQVPAAPTLAPPGDFRGELTPDGVRLTWATISSPPEIAGLRFSCRVYRREQRSNKDAVAGEIAIAPGAPATLTDHGLEWEKTYAYRATIVTYVAQANGEQQVEGDDTPAVSVFAHDIFPPAAPAGLEAAFSGPGQKSFIDLVWTPNAESDLAGYDVYRHEPGGQPVKVNSDLVTAPAFRDTQVISGREYFYSVTAVDIHRNESPHSQEANETVP
jgi:hypothetical protein